MASGDINARQWLLDGLAAATDQLGQALSALGAAYEQLDEQQGERLEQALFRPAQRAYGRARRSHAEFAGRHGLARREFTMPEPGLPSTGDLQRPLLNLVIAILGGGVFVAVLAKFLLQTSIYRRLVPL